MCDVILIARHTTLGLRLPVTADLSMMIEAAARAAWSTDRGYPTAAAVISALRAAGVILPAAGVIERTAIAGRARARSRVANAILIGISDAEVAKLDRLFVLDASVNMTPFSWLKAAPIAPKADHVSELLDRLKLVRSITNLDAMLRTGGAPSSVQPSSTWRCD